MSLAFDSKSAICYRNLVWISLPKILHKKVEYLKSDTRPLNVLQTLAKSLGQAFYVYRYVCAGILGGGMFCFF